MKTITPTKHTQAIWLSDLHLDQASDTKIQGLLARLRKTESDCVMITGDLSSAKNLLGYLRSIAKACFPRPVYFVCGNHDYYGSSMRDVDGELVKLSRNVQNLHFLNGDRIIPLSASTCLIGYRGLADARAGWGENTRQRSPDHRAIRDFHALSHVEAMQLMQAQGRETASKIRKLLPAALRRFRHVVLMTHCPPFACSAIFDGQQCSRVHLPHYVCLSSGMAIQAIARAFPKRRVTILAGHTHSEHNAQVGSNIQVRVAGAKTGHPGVVDVLRIA